jgi:predicted nucleic acid-binding protein
MSWLPDTNVWIQILKQPGGSLEHAVLGHSPDQIYLC